MTIGRVLYQNLVRDPEVQSINYSGTETPGFEVANAFDWRDYSLFRPEVGSFNIDVILGEDRVLDSAAWYIKSNPENVITVGVQYESPPAFFNTLAGFSSDIDPDIALKTFDEVTLVTGARLRFVVNSPITAEDIRQLIAGPILEFPIGQHQGIAPPNLRGEFVMSNVIGVNGSFLGRDKVRAELQGEINLELVDPQDWVRDEWLALMEHAERFAFFYAWDLDDFLDEIVFAWARSTPRPENTGPNAKMTTILPWSALAT